MDEEQIYGTRRLDAESEEPEPLDEAEVEEEAPVAPPPLPEADEVTPPPLPESETLVVMTPPVEAPVEAEEITPDYQSQEVTFGSSAVVPEPEIPSPFDDAESAPAPEVEAEPAAVTPPPVTPSYGGGRQPTATAAPPSSSSKPPKKNNTLLIVLIVVGALLVLCCCCAIVGGVLYPIVEEMQYMWLLQGLLGLLL